METIVLILIGVIAAAHLYFLWLEMFAWEAKGKTIFKTVFKNNKLPQNTKPPQDLEYLFTQTKGLAANQGLYNGFLAAGLIWSFFISDTIWKTNISIFFLSCVALAGIYGGLLGSSPDKKIFFVQALPAIIVLALLLFD
jgi:putative membrane protein